MRRPAEPGMPLEAVETPALLVARDALLSNIQGFAAYLQEVAPNVRLRAHAKTHKSPDIARLQVAAGAVGVCCQTVGEAEAMAAGGITDILLTNQIAGRDKAVRLAVLGTTCRVGACVDHPMQIELLSEAADVAGAVIHVLVEIDVGGGRCGVTTAQDACALAALIGKKPSLRFAGIQAYQGMAQHLRKPGERRDAIARASEVALTIADSLSQSGFPCESITGAGTGTFEFEAMSGIYTELQCGSYVLMDQDYAENDRDPGSNAPTFAHSLTVLATVVSMPAPDRAVCDAGSKAMSFDRGRPDLSLHLGLSYVGPSDEHGTLHVAPGTLIAPGDRVQIIPGHCDPTVAMHDWIVLHDGTHVTDLWPITRNW